jgi:hypothetical protein
VDLREHYISSFFLHVIGALLMVAASQHQSELPDNFMVSLLVDASGVASQSPDEVKAITTGPQTSSEARDPETEAPDVAVEMAGKSVPAAQEFLSSSEIPQEAASVSPGPDMMKTALARKMADIHIRAYVSSASKTLRKSLKQEIESDFSGGMREGSAEIMLYFNDQGEIDEVRGSSSSELLDSALGRLDWGSLSSPKEFRVRLRELIIRLDIINGEPRLTLTAS